MVMEAEKSQDLQPASWRPGKASGVHSSLKAEGSRPKIIQCFHLSLKSEKDQYPSSSSQARRVLFYLCKSQPFCSKFRTSAYQMMPTHIREVICFTQTIGSNANLSKNTLTDTLRKMFDQIIWESHGPIKMTYKINHHNWVTLSSNSILCKRQVCETNERNAIPVERYIVGSPPCPLLIL